MQVLLKSVTPTILQTEHKTVADVADIANLKIIG